MFFVSLPPFAKPFGDHYIQLVYFGLLFWYFLSIYTSCFYLSKKKNLLCGIVVKGHGQGMLALNFNFFFFFSDIHLLSLSLMREREREREKEQN